MKKFQIEDSDLDSNAEDLNLAAQDSVLDLDSVEVISTTTLVFSLCLCLVIS